MTSAIDEEREDLLPRIERDQRELAAAVGDLKTASAESGRRAVRWLAAVVIPIVAARMGSRARRRRILSSSAAPAMSVENVSQRRAFVDALLNGFRMPAKPLPTASPTTESLFTLAAGVLLGTGIALLLAPKTGAETRRDLARRFNLNRNEESAEEVRADAALAASVTQITPSTPTS
jgi:hypothetical protein